MFPISNTQYRTNNKMKSYLGILFCLCMMLLISDASQSDEVASLLTAFKARLLERRPEGDTTVATDKNRKMIEVRDPSYIVDGKYIIIFDPDSVANATDKSMQLFTKIDWNGERYYALLKEGHLAGPPSRLFFSSVATYYVFRGRGSGYSPP